MTISIARAAALCAAALALAGAAAPAWSQYKVVNPDGSVTYTDRPPIASNVRITPMGRLGRSAATAAEPGLPPELRTPAQRQPVTLYTSNECAPCDSGRRLLQTRGVPYTERRIVTEDDAAALERLVGGRTVPALTIGAQPLRGLSEADWAAYLDAAGYPRENKLPRGWQPPLVTPLVERSAPAVVAAPRPASPAPAPSPEDPAPTPGRIRF
jgi:glutaredoxin